MKITVTHEFEMYAEKTEYKELMKHDDYVSFVYDVDRIIQSSFNNKTPTTAVREITDAIYKAMEEREIYPE